MQTYTKLALISTVLFLLVGLSATYNATQGVLGNLVGQSGGDYGSGNALSSRGFLLHAIVFYFAMFFILKKQK